jgi:hypothetical protein
MLSKLKNYLLKKDIAAHKPQRKRTIHSLKTAKSIAVIAEITDEDSYKNIFSLFRQLQQYGLKVFLLGYIHNNAVPFFCLKQLTTEYFCKKELNFYGKPAIPRLDSTLNEPFDMLIDFTEKNYTPISYILQVSYAQFIVGANQHHRPLYDFFLDFGKEYTAQELSQMIDFYTNKLTDKQ